MRWLVFLVATAAVLVGAAFAFAGESGGGGKRAFALVDPSGPRLVDAHTRGFDAVSVGPAGPGDYCLTPSEGVDVVDTAAVASTEAFFSNVFGIAAVRYPTSGLVCPAGDLEVKTFTANPVALTDQIGFTVIVP